MPDKFDEIRKTLKNNVMTELQARKLAQAAVAVIAPKAVKMERRLSEAFLAVANAEQFRGESEMARESAIKVLDEALEEAKKTFGDQPKQD